MMTEALIHRAAPGEPIDAFFDAWSAAHAEAVRDAAARREGLAPPPREHAPVRPGGAPTGRRAGQRHRRRDDGGGGDDDAMRRRRRTAGSTAAAPREHFEDAARRLQRRVPGVCASPRLTRRGYLVWRSPPRDP